MNADFFTVFKAINQADVTPGVKLNAFRLLERAPDGPVRIEWAEVEQITGIQSRGAIRKVFGALQATHLIHYHTGTHVWYTFFEDRNPK